jgi:23S rRNA (pseudouridine1915-N3)-methyltransferase
MKIKLLVAGRTEESYLKTGIEEYLRRINFYLPFEIHEIPAPKRGGVMSQEQVKTIECQSFEKYLQQGDYIVLLDEKGKEMTSTDFAGFLNRVFNQHIRSLVFIVGGAYGFDEKFKSRVSFKLSLSQMTFNHQMVRLFFTEQLYRALTILKGESYHHQ